MTALDLLHNPCLTGAGLAVIHFLWQGALAAAVLALLLRLLRHATPQARYAACCITLAVMAALPVATFLWVRPVVTPPAPDMLRALDEWRGDDAGAAGVATLSPATPGPVASSGGGNPSGASVTLLKTRGHFPARLSALCNSSAPWAGLLWFFGAVGLSLRLVSGYAHANSLRRYGVLPAPACLTERLEDLCGRLNVRRRVALYESRIVPIPAVLGVLRPVILLPGSLATGLSMPQLEAVLAHELAHVMRHDCLVNIIQSVVEAMLFFHPAVWWVSRRIRVEREHCCDDIAAAPFGNVAYARALAALAERCAAPPAMAMAATGGGLAGRVRRLVRGNSGGVAPSYRWLSGMLAVGLIALCLAGAVLAGERSDEKILVFPTYSESDESCLGMLYARDVNAPDGAPWRLVGPANGEVRVPAGDVLRLKAPAWTSVDLSPLADLAPDALYELDLDMVRVDADDMAAAGALTGLRRLNLNGTGVSDEGMSYLYGLTSLEWLGLEGTALTGEGLAFIEAMPALRSLYLRETPITDDGLVHLAGLTSLERLGLAMTRVTGAGLASLSGLPALKYLNLFKAPVGDEGMVYLGATASLEWLDLERTGVTDAGLAHLAGLRNLTTLNLHANPVYGPGLAALTDLPRLESLNLQNTPLTDAALRYVGLMKSLRLLKLPGPTRNTPVPERYGPMLTDQGLEYLRNLKALEALILDRTDVGDEGMAVLAGLPSLKYLKLDYTHVGDAGLETLGTSTSLERIRCWGSPASSEGRRAVQMRLSPDGDAAPPRVGVLFSHYTATGPSWIGTPYTHDRASRLSRILIDQGFDVYAVIDPGSEHEPGLVDMLTGMALTERIIDGSDPDALGCLDVVAMLGAPNLRDDVIAGITRAVERGVGLVTCSGCGGVNPGPEDEGLRALLGLSKPEFFWLHGTMVCPVVNAHPILGGLDAGDEMVVESLCGFAGELDGTPLLGAPFAMDADFCPLLVRDLGEGRVVRVQWFSMSQITARCTAEEFFEGRMFSWDELVGRCVNWAARLPADVRW
jgi:beta-lactamase regulating signal transducer with metallopeptidase domain